MTTRPEVHQLSEGDSIKWRLPNGVTDEATIGSFASRTEEGFAFFDAKERAISSDGNGYTHSYRRCVKTDWLTHFRGRRLRPSPNQSRQPEEDGVEFDTSAPRQTVLGIGKEAQMATRKKTTRKPAPKKSAAKTKAAAGKVPAGSRKSLDDMSESHRKHIEFWGPHQDNLRAEFVWIAIRRFPERSGDGLYYVAVKRGDKDYAIVSYDTSKPAKVTKRNVMDEGFETSSAMLEAFKEYRQLAKDERNEARAKANPPKAKAKPKASPAAKKATAAAKKRTTKKPPVRRKAPARTKK